MTHYHDLTLIPESAYKLAELINGDHYNNIFYFEFHEEVGSSKILNCLEGLNEFQKRSQDFYKIFISPINVDEKPAIIHIVIKVADEWFISLDIGSNFYLGYGPSGILKLREACAKRNITAIATDENVNDWLRNNFILERKQTIKDSQSAHKLQFEKLCRALERLTADLQRRPKEYQGLNEDNLRDRLLIPLNIIFKGRGHAESKNRQGKTDILIRTNDGLNEHIFELKVWRGINSLTSAINQLKGYLSWHNDYCGILLFNYNNNFTGILKKIEKYIDENFTIDKKHRNIRNEFRFFIQHQTDSKKTILCHLCCINLKN
jgi:hypothetical protein